MPNETCSVISEKQSLKEFSKEAAEAVRIQYGGQCKNLETLQHNMAQFRILMEH